MNEHIENYCIDYIESEFNPQFAVLIKGEWGCGKTYFINKLISRYIQKGKNIQRNEIVYISLFGIGHISEIDDKLFQKMHPILSSENFKLAAGFIRTAMKIGVNINGAGVLNFGGFEKKPQRIKSKELEKKLIIVDDIERTKLSPIEIFGYFSEYLNQLNMKLIFIGNDDQISSIDGEKSSYQKIKEKIIGVEFTIEPEIEKAVDSFIQEFSFGDDMKYIRDNYLEAISILNCKNLRIVRQCLFNLKLLFKTLNEEIIEKDGNEISKIFINLFIQKCQYIISKKEQIYEAIVGFDEQKMDYKRYIKYKEEKNIFFDYYNKSIPLRNIWPNIIFDGYYSKQTIISIYQQEESDKEASKQKNLFILISNWRSMIKREFRDIIDTVDNEFENGVYLHPGEILHYVNIMILFCEWKLIPKTRIDFIRKTKIIIGNFKEKIIPIDDWEMLDFEYGGWGYSDKISEVREMRQYLEIISNDNMFIVFKSIIEEEVRNINNDVWVFCKNIKHRNGTNKYYRKPFLYLVNLDEFFHILSNLPIEDQNLVIESLEERYGTCCSNGSVYNEYKPDKDNLIKLSEMYDNSLGDIEYNPPEFLKSDISKRLHKLIEYFE